MADPNEEIVVTANRRQTSFDIDTVRSSIRNEGTLPKHSFLVTMSPFGGDQAASRILNRYLVGGPAATEMVMRCDSATLPAPTAFKDEVRRYGYGPVEEVAYGMQFGDFMLSFLVDRFGTQVKFFDDWMNLITNYESKGGSLMTQASDRSGMKPYEVGYKDDYANRQMTVTVYDRSANQVMIYELYDVFPTSVNTSDVNWADTDQLVHHTIRFAYTDYTLSTPQIENSGILSPPPPASQVSGQLAGSLGGATAVGTFASTGTGRSIVISNPSIASNPTSIVTNIGTALVRTLPSDKTFA